MLLLGCGASAVLFGATLIDLGDPGATAQARLEAEAQSEGKLVHTRWRERLSGEAWLAATVDAREITISPPLVLAPALTDTGSEDEDDRIRLLAARAASARVNTPELERLTGAVLARKSARSGAALLALVRGLRRAEASEDAAAAFSRWAEDVPWNAAVDGTSGRLLAFLSAAGALDAETRQREARAFADALQEGRVALPTPDDSAHATPTGWVIELDAWWTTLRGTAEERAAVDGFDWSAALRVESRGEAAIARAAGAAAGAGWQLRPIAGTTCWLATRRTGDRLRLAIPTDAALAETVAGLALSTEGLVAAAFVERGDIDVVADADALESAGIPLTIHHPDPGALAGRERQRLAWLRGGLIALGLLVLLTTAAASRLIARARALQGLRSTFVASVSHDLRTPLAAISLMAENLASGYAKGNEDRYVDSIRRETTRLGRLVDDLLDFGRIERGLPPRISRREVATDEWLDAFEASERARCTAAGCTLSVERSGLPERAHFDVSALERALGNLIDNALKHAETESIRLRVHGETAGLLEFEVEDAGKGLPRGVVHEQLFEPFRRAGEASGTGLGLAIVRAIAEAHGGTATLAPAADGTGLCATLRVRCGEETAA